MARAIATIPGFDVIGKLGRGRLGPIYEATAAGDGPLLEDGVVAVQLVDDEFASSPDVVDELRRGFATLRAGQHPNIVEILEFEHGAGACLVVMECLEGASLRFVLDESGPLPVNEVIPILANVGRAAQFLHAKRIVHGAFRPEAVFVTDALEVKLLDIMPQLSVSRSKSLDRRELLEFSYRVRDDVFGLACLTYELLSGRHPFNSNSAEEAMRAHLKPLPIDGLNEKPWRALQHGMAFDSALRTHTIDQFLGEFGVVGNERLKTLPVERMPANFERARQHAPVDVPNVRPEISPAATPEARPETSPEARPEVSPLARPASAKSAQTSGAGRVVQTLLVLAVLAVVVGMGWVYREQAIDLVDERIEAFVSRAQNSSDEPTIAVTPEPIASVDRSASPDQVASDQPSSSSDVAGAIESEASRGAESSEFGAAADLGSVRGLDEARADAEGVDQSGEVAFVETERELATPPDVPRQSAEPDPVDPVTVADPGPERFRFSAATLATNEGQAFVRLVIRRSGSSERSTPVVWWTSADTATADDDFAESGETTISFAAGDTEQAILIPLIDDGIAEPSEAFWVYLGMLDQVSGRLETLDSARVTINDDD